MSAVPTSTSPDGRSKSSPSLGRVTNSSGNWSRSRADSCSAHSSSATSWGLDAALWLERRRSRCAMISRSRMACLQIGDVPVEPVPELRPLVRVLYSQHLQGRVVQLAAVVQRELLVQVAPGFSAGHPLAGGDGPCRGFRRCVANVGDEHHVHVDDLRLEVALDACGPAELVLGQGCHSAVERRPQQVRPKS